MLPSKENTMQKIAVKNEALPLLRSGMALKEKILSAKAENYLRRLKAFEKKHRMKSDKFAEKFKSGKLGDNEQWFDWLFVYEAYKKITARHKVIKSLS
jgi:hypothetical protein